jgi:hypothetical protein
LKRTHSWRSEDSNSQDRLPNQIALWNGTQWSTLGDGPFLANFYEEIYAVARYNGQWVVGGSFSDQPGQSSVPPNNCIARWNGIAWQAIGSGLDSDCLALMPYGPDLWVGGYFQFAGNKPSTSIARRSVPLVAVSPGEERIATVSQVFRNPTSSVSMLTVQVFDARGRLVRKVPIDSPVTGSTTCASDGADDAGRLALPGLYFARVSTRGAVELRKILRLGASDPTAR